MKNRFYFIIGFLLLFPRIEFAVAQDTLFLTLPQAVNLSHNHSPEATAARHAFRAAYWNWRSFKANLLPSLSLLSTPYLNRTISAVTLEDGNDRYIHRNQLSVDAGLEVNQNIPLTGGSVFVNTSLERLDLFSEKKNYYKSSPFTIGYQQNLFGYNQLKWDKKIEPVRYQEARKELIETLEFVASGTAGRFFQLALAQSAHEIAQTNYAYADTLYQFARGRYDIGTITENEMLQLELSLLTEEVNKINSRIQMDNYIQEFRSYLGIQETVEIKVLPDHSVPVFTVNMEEALCLAYENNPEPEQMKRLKLESESHVAQAKSQRGLKADLYMEFGLTQSNRKFKQAYHNPLDQQLVSIGIRIPIMDWGVGKGRVKVAISNRDKVYTEVEQQRTDFETNVIKMVKQFNIQAGHVALAYKKDQTAERRNEVARKLYLLGKSDILDLNASVSEKGNARQSYIQSLYNYWNLYYGLRSITGFDLENNQPLTAEYEQLMK